MDFDGFSRTLVGEAGDAIILCDAEGVIRFWNRSAERIFGYPRRDAIGQSLDIIIPENLRERHWKGYAEMMRTGRSKYGEGDTLAVPALRADGQRISIEFTVLPLRDGEGSTQGIAAILRDVTKRFEEMKALRARARQERSE